MNKPCKQPTAIILASQALESGLKTIFGNRETASLMIAGSTLIEHILKELQDLNFSQCIVLAGDNARDIYDLSMTSNHWGMNIEVMSSPLRKEEILREYKSMSEPNGLLLIEANKLRSHSVKQFLEVCNNTDYLLYDAVNSNDKLGLTYLKPSSANFIINPKLVELNQVKLSPLRNIQDFHQANIELIKGQFTGLDSSVSYQSIGNRLQHWSAKVHKRTRVEKLSVMIDRRCRVERHVNLNSVVLNRDVYVDRNTTLDNTIVMPDTIIPANHSISNAIIHGENVYRL